MACSDEKISTEKELSGGGDQPSKEDPTDNPYEYDNDLDYDAEAFVKAYTGTVYAGPHLVLGILEAENFDNGNQNIAYNKSDEKIADEAYRGAHAVDIRASSNASEGYYIGDVQPGEWMCYTIEVVEEGTYDIDVYCDKGDGTEGNFYFEVDGCVACRHVNMPLGDWNDFSQKVTAKSILLTKGMHILKYFESTPVNIDKFVLRRTGALEDSVTEFEYPMTKEVSNPLFAEFGSPMYNSWLTGNLYTADSSVHVWNIDGKEVLYVYASHDMEPTVGCDRMDRYHVFSTEDMVSWTDYGEIMNATTVRLHDGWGSDGFMWVPDCVYNPSN